MQIRFFILVGIALAAPAGAGPSPRHTGTMSQASGAPLLLAPSQPLPPLPRLDLLSLLAQTPARAGGGPQLLPWPPVTVGQTRADLEREYVGEGGLCSRTKQAYLLRDPQTGGPLRNRDDGSYTRILVRFQPVPRPRGRAGEPSGLPSPSDVIISLSRPYRGGPPAWD